MCMERESKRTGDREMADYVREYRFYFYPTILVIFALNISINICAPLPLFD